MLKTPKFDRSRRMEHFCQLRRSLARRIGGPNPRPPTDYEAPRSGAPYGVARVGVKILAPLVFGAGWGQKFWDFGISASARARARVRAHLRRGTRKIRNSKSWQCVLKPSKIDRSQRMEHFCQKKQALARLIQGPKRRPQYKQMYEHPL